ncbi:MAG: glycerol-3-phosphate 1-O-acyltransferase [Acidimicrobiia bacterium]
MTDTQGALTDENRAYWPKSSGPFVALLDASSKLESKIIETWIKDATADVKAPVVVFGIPPSRRQRRFASVDPAIGERLTQQDDPLCIPLRVVWLAKKRDGVRQVALSDLLKFGDPRDPNFVRQKLILAQHPDRCRVIVGEPARKSDLEDRWSDPAGRGPADGTTLGEFVALQAWLALERTERHIRGLRYKVPKFLREDLFWSRPFQAGVERLSRSEGKPSSRMRKRTGRYLKEMAAQHSPYVIDLVNVLTTKVINAAHHDVDYSEADLRRIYQLAENDPLIFLPSHKSNFDHLVLQHVLYQNELPLNHTAGGVNMNFFLIGPLLRRSGIFFIRRAFKDNEAYKFVLHQYLDYLLEKCFALEWYIEGGRSRSGKLREPMMGLLAYVADSYQRGITNDVVLIPVSINYDQIIDVGSYTDEQRGAQKEKESFLWAVRIIGSLRRRNGRIYVRFGEPLLLSDRLDRDEDLSTPEGRLALPKIAFEVATRINDVTPITAISLVTLALLSEERRGLTVTEVDARIAPFMRFIDDRELPITDDLPFRSHSEIEAALEALVLSGVVSRSEGLTNAIYGVAQGKHLAAAYYRNTIIHFFVNAGITELALGVCAARESRTTRGAVIDRALELRDLLKFEFFFSPSTAFAQEISEEIDRSTVADGETGDIAGLAQDALPPKSPIVLRPFLEAYFVIASTLAVHGSEKLSEGDLVKRALRMGEQLAAHGEISNREAVSTALFATGIKLAASKGLLDGSEEDRLRFRSDLSEILDTLTTIRAWDSVYADRPTPCSTSGVLSR